MAFKISILNASILRRLSVFNADKMARFPNGLRDAFDTYLMVDW
jgi:hypothetical protein